jgi:hypothetical protein
MLVSPRMPTAAEMMLKTAAEDIGITFVREQCCLTDHA